MVFEDRRREIYESWPKYQREVSEYNHALYEKFRIKQETVDAFESYLRDTNNPSLEQYYDNKVKGKNNLVVCPKNVSYVQTLLLIVHAFVVGFFLRFVTDHL